MRICIAERLFQGPEKIYPRLSVAGNTPRERGDEGEPVGWEMIFGCDKLDER